VLIVEVLQRDASDICVRDERVHLGVEVVDDCMEVGDRAGVGKLALEVRRLCFRVLDVLRNLLCASLASSGGLSACIRVIAVLKTPTMLSRNVLMAALLSSRVCAEPRSLFSFVLASLLPVWPPAKMLASCVK